MPFRNFLLMKISTILKYRRLHTKSSYSIYLETFPILNCCSNNSTNVFFNIQCNGHSAKIRYWLKLRIRKIKYR